MYKFLKNLVSNYKNIEIFILSGGEKNEIELFLQRHSLDIFFKKILASELSKSEHLKNIGVSSNDIFIGDTLTDLETSLNSGIKFILMEGYKSLKSFPKQESIKKNSLLSTYNFQSLLELIE